MFSGSLVAIVSPMHEDGTLDFEALRRLIDWHVDEGSNGIVIVGTTGESPTVDPEEHVELVRVAVQAARGRVPLIAGTGGNSTREAIELTTHAKRVGANASLQVVPYYNKPPQEGLYRHFRAVAEAVDLPLILYNVPGRTVADLSAETTVRLAQIPGIVGLKDATGDLARAADLLRRLPQQFALYSGNDDSALALLLLGGRGVISVTANVAPRLMRELCDAALAGEVARARAINARLMPLHLRLFLEPNPIPVKWALHRMGRIESGIRLPLVPLSPPAREVLESAMRDFGLI